MPMTMYYVLSLAWPLELIQPLPLLAYAYAYGYADAYAYAYGYARGIWI